MEVFVRNLRTQIIAAGVLKGTSDRYWSERRYAAELLASASDICAIMLLDSTKLTVRLITEEMDREWEQSWFLPEREEIRAGIIDTITGELSRMGIKINGRTRDGVLIEAISAENIAEIREIVGRLYPGIIPSARVIAD